MSTPRCSAWPMMLLGLLLAAFSAVHSPAADWSSWRGPDHNGTSGDTDLPAKWSPNPDDPDSNLVWKVPYGCRSTPIVQGGRVYINNQVGEGVNEQERFMCFDDRDGKLLWEKRFNVFHTDIVSVRLGWTAPAGDPKTGNVYWHGTQGYLVCFDRDGKVLWQRSLTEEFGRVSGYGGRLSSPIIDEDLVIVGMLNSSWGEQGKGGSRFVAFNKYDGKAVWWSETPGAPKNTYYSTPVIAVINGQRLLISGAGNGGIHALKARTGEVVWSYYIGREDVNVSPIISGNYVYCGHGNVNLGENVQGCMVCLDASKVKDNKPALVWHEEMLVRFTTPILHDGRLYIADDVASLHCLDAKTGKALWEEPFEYGRAARGSPVLADGKIYVTDINAKFHILKPGPKGCQPLHTHTFKAKQGSPVELYSSPAIANGRVYFGSADELIVIGKKNWKGSPGKVAELPKEPPLGEPAGVRLDPADIVLHPGESASFKVVVLDANGRELKDASVPKGEWLLPAPAPPPGKKLNPPALKATVEGGKLTVDAKVPSQQGVVVFSDKLGKATARVRVVARLPYSIDFDKLPDGATPGGWVNAQGKFWVTTLKDGNKVLRNNNTVASPLLSKVNAYISLPGLTDYTIEADVQGTRKGSDMPDIGLVANRYTLLLKGNYQQLQIVSWDAMPRIAPTKGFKWEPETWYTLKLRTEPQGGKARLLGKVWPRGQKEPAEWTIEYLDPTPNREGSPGVFGYGQGIIQNQPGTDIYYDNIRITPNKK